MEVDQFVASGWMANNDANIEHFKVKFGSKPFSFLPGDVSGEPVDIVR